MSHDDGRERRSQLLPSEVTRGFAAAAAKVGAGKPNEKQAPAAPELPKHDVDIIRELAPYLWPKDNPELRARVVGALGLLVASKARPMD